MVTRRVRFAALLVAVGWSACIIEDRDLVIVDAEVPPAIDPDSEAMGSLDTSGIQSDVRDGSRGDH